MLAFGFSNHSLHLDRNTQKRGVHIKKISHDSMALYSTVPRRRTCWGMMDVIWPHCVSRRVFSCLDAPPLTPCADSSLRYFSAPPPPPALCLNPKGEQTGVWKQNYFPRLPFQICHLCQLNRQMKEKLRKLNLSPWSHNPRFICPPPDYCSFLREIGEGGMGHECCYNSWRCKEWGSAIKGNPLHFFAFFRWLTCFRGAMRSP